MNGSQDKPTGSLKAVMDRISPNDWLIRADGWNRYVVVTPHQIDDEGRSHIRDLFWHSTILDFRETANGG